MQNRKQMGIHDAQIVGNEPPEDIGRVRNQAIDRYKDSPYLPQPRHHKLPGLPSLNVSPSRDPKLGERSRVVNLEREALLDEISHMKAAINGMSKQLFSEESYQSILESENRKLIQQLEDLEAMASKGPSCMIKELMQGARTKLEDLLAKSQEQRAEIVDLAKDMRLTSNREIEAERGVLMQEVIRLQEVSRRQRDELGVMKNRIKMIPLWKERSLKLEMMNAKLQEHLLASQRDATKLHNDIGTYRQVAKEHAIQARQEAKRWKMLQDSFLDMRNQVERTSVDRQALLDKIRNLEEQSRKIRKDLKEAKACEDMLLARKQEQPKASKKQSAPKASGAARSPSSPSPPPTSPSPPPPSPSPPPPPAPAPAQPALPEPTSEPKQVVAQEPNTPEVVKKSGCC